MGESENRQCQNCKNDFAIEPDDFAFYEKMKVPAPTFCPDCRMQRRMAWRNNRNLYKSSCGAPGHSETIVSLYSSEKKIVVYDQAYWWSQKHDPLSYGRSYDFSVPFFLQFSQLLGETPLPSLSNVNAVETEYANMTIDSKNCYLIFGSSKNENCSYSEGIQNCRDSIDLLVSRNSERCFWCIDCESCFSVFFSTKAINCRESAFLFDCKNCSNCFGCWSLRNKQYCIFNEQYSKENYLKKFKAFDLGSYAQLQEVGRVMREKLHFAVNKFANIMHSENVTGDRIDSSHNCHYAFDIAETSDCKYVWRLLQGGGSNNYDISIATKPTLSYEGQGVGEGHASKFTLGSGDISEAEYTHSCISGCSHLFGCVGLLNKHYCILNRQYTKEEYENLVPKIIAHMNEMPYAGKNGRVYKYGEFFPIELSPFSYNETIAQEYFPLTKEQALEKGYHWKDHEEKSYQIDIKSENLPDDIKNVKEDLIGKIVECLHKGECNEQCTKAFKVTIQELQFYKKMNIALPRLCPNCRHYGRLAERNPLKLWYRKCMKPGCNNEFETSYAPDRPEIVYCESCYNEEVA